MCWLRWTVFILMVLCLGRVCSDASGGSPCILTKTGALGTCKLISDCESVRIAIVKHQTLPQTCGFQETQALVCCPKNEGEKRGPIRGISKMKCKEYSSFANEECGHKIVKRIVNGVTATRKEFPHMALIGFGQERQVAWLCGGNIISEYFILTTASCLSSGIKGKATYVRIGVTHLNSSDHMQEFKIAESIPHPNYRNSRTYHDIGLIKLQKAINFNSYARPACLYTDLEISSIKAIATGWGYISSYGPTSDKLLKVTLNLVNYDTCNETFHNTWGWKYGVDEATQLCAWGNDRKDTCLGDAGGPLQIYHTGDDINCMYDIVGISSLDRGCGTTLPGLYTKVSPYVKWIEDTVWRDTA